jgi:hypothetical protein
MIFENKLKLDHLVKHKYGSPIQMIVEKIIKSSYYSCVKHCSTLLLSRIKLVSTLTLCRQVKVFNIKSDPQVLADQTLTHK